MSETQTATLQFMGPVAAAYVGACALWWLIFVQLRSRWWPVAEDFAPRRPWMEFGLALLVAVAVLAVGRVYDAGWLLPAARGTLGLIAYDVNMLIVFAPLLGYLIWRRQPLASVWCDLSGLAVKVGFGLAAAALALVVYLGLRGELGLLTGVLGASVTSRALAHFLPVFLEGLGLAFLFVRLETAVGRGWAIAIPCLLFAIAHVPGALAEGRAWGHVAAFFVFNTGLPAVILFVVTRSRDVIWLGILHYFMDVAIRTF